MKLIIFLLAFVFAVTTLVQAQNKTITVYYNGDSTEVVNLANTDSIIIFICGVSRVYYEGKVYNTVPIGNQCWLKENLEVGTRIDGSLNQTNNGGSNIIEKYCYNDLDAYCTTYGGLYQWNEAMQYSTNPGVQGICPEGWHIPTLAEFQKLSTAVGSSGNALKAIGQGTGDGTGTNTSGFTALLAGIRFSWGAFGLRTNYTYFWSSTEYSADNAEYIDLNWYTDNIYFANIEPKVNGFSVRCVKD